MPFAADPAAMPSDRLTASTLWSRVEAQTRHAIACQALHSIPTFDIPFPTAKIPFVVRQLANIARKQTATAQAPPDFNPFLPCDPDLLVGDIGDRHRCVLNKFNVSPDHILLVTRDFEPQINWLNATDWAAVALAWQTQDALMFYNSGDPAGASQRHKHVQLLPLPLTDTAPRVPIEAVFDQIDWVPQPVVTDTLEPLRSPDLPTTIAVGTVMTLPFQHAIARLPKLQDKALSHAGQTLTAIYRTLLHIVGINHPATDFLATPAYNCLATREWLMIVPRTHSEFQAIGVNSLGFAGTFLVRDAAQLELLQTHGILKILTDVAIAR